MIHLSSKLIVSFSPADAQGLEEASPEQISEIEIDPAGLGLHFPRLDADLYVPALLQGVLGTRKWMAARMGAVGGKSRSKVKQAASRANGRWGEDHGERRSAWPRSIIRSASTCGALLPCIRLAELDRPADAEY